MYLELKKSKLTDWWVAEENDKMNFVNILSGKALRCNLKVTAQGSFYPFEEDHPLYLQFLIYANKENTLIGYHWDFVDGESKEKIVADIIDEGTIREDVIFDFVPSESEVMLSGYSKELSRNVVLATFSRRNVGCLTIHGIADFVKADIYNSSFTLLEELQEKITKVKEIFSNKVKEKYISVKVGMN